jgi:hypothetical protein
VNGLDPFADSDEASRGQKQRSAARVDVGGDDLKFNGWGLDFVVGQHKGGEFIKELKELATESQSL